MRGRSIVVRVLKMRGQSLLHSILQSASRRQDQSLSPKTRLSPWNFFFFPVLPYETDRSDTSPIGAVAAVAFDIWLDCRIWNRGRRGAMPSELIGRASSGMGGTGMLLRGSGHSGVERRCSLGDLLTCGEFCSEAPISLSSSIGVSGSPWSRFRCCGGRGISAGGATVGRDVSAGTVEPCDAVTAFFFFPRPKNPRFAFDLPPPSNEGNGACLLSRNEPLARLAPCPFVLPLDWPLSAPLTTGLCPSSLFVAGTGTSSASSSRSVESPSSSPTFRGIPRTGARPGGNT
jgi:hypothetical protein